jgi:hypothetical protein
MKASELIRHLSTRYGWNPRPLNSTPEAFDFFTNRIPGVALIAIRKGTKRAVGKEWQKTGAEEMANPKYVAQLRKSQGLGMSLGNPSGHVISVDIDDDELIEPFFEMNPDLRKTLVTRGKGGATCF